MRSVAPVSPLSPGSPAAPAAPDPPDGKRATQTHYHQAASFRAVFLHVARPSHLLSVFPQLSLTPFMTCVTLNQNTEAQLQFEIETDVLSCHVQRFIRHRLCESSLRERNGSDSAAVETKYLESRHSRRSRRTRGTDGRTLQTRQWCNQSACREKPDRWRPVQWWRSSDATVSEFRRERQLYVNIINNDLTTDLSTHHKYACLCCIHMHN